jgi:aminoglycoside phosphotransferase family enzyme
MNSEQLSIIDHLKNNTAYSHPAYDIRLIETHISWIFLTGPFTYKVKKKVKFGQVLDFSNLLLRKKYCKKELILNKPLCGNMYQNVVKIVKENKTFKFAELSEKGEPVEYAVKMIEIPQKFRMDSLLQRGKISKKIIESLTDLLIEFHNNSLTNNKISKCGLPHVMKYKIKENFETLLQLGKMDPIIQSQMNLFLERNNNLFIQRISESKIRDIHGDLYLKNIFIIENKFYLYDRIEFNDSLRYADVTEDVAHLAMDLEFHNKSDLSKYLIREYIKKSHDDTMSKLIYFMMCYKACVRAKVSFFRSQEIYTKNKKKIHEQEAKKHLRLAKQFIKFFEYNKTK